MTARTEILGRISAKHADSDPSSRAAAVKARIQQHAKGLIPNGPQDEAGVLAYFIKKAKEAEASVVSVANDKVGDAISDYLRSNNLPQEIRCGDDPRIGAIQWPQKATIEVKHGPSDGTDLACLSHAFGAAAETGTMALVSGADNPTTLNFLPEHHIVVLDAKDVSWSYEAIWDKLRKTYGERNMPRTVNMITGPSRSADIEQTLILGAHGPVKLHIIVVQD